MSDGIRLGEGLVASGKNGTIWDDLSGERSRPRSPNPPQIAAGSVVVGHLDVAFDADDVERRLRVVVDTRGGQFERTPLYFASVGALNRGETRVGAPLRTIAGWFSTILDPTPTRFTLQVQAHIEQDAFWSFITEGSYPDWSVEVSWIGVLPRRPGVKAIDPRSMVGGHIARFEPTVRFWSEETIE
jgi:hypothetical protein